MPELPKKLPKQYRTHDLESARVTRAEDEGKDGKPPRFRVVLLTSKPTDRWYGTESLSMEKSAVDLTRTKKGVPLFLEHGGTVYSTPQMIHVPNPELRVGIAEDFEIAGEELICWLRFSPSARGQEAQAEFEAGITPYLSGGYLPIKIKQTKKAATAEERNEFTVTRWRPVEASIVCFPADYSATEKRSEDGEQYDVEIDSDPSLTEDPMKLHHQNAPPASGAGAPAPASAPAATAVVEVRSEGPGSAAAGAQAAAASATASATQRAVEIYQHCETHGMQARATEWINSGMSVADVKGAILDAKASAVRPQPAAEALQAIPAKDRRRYSIGRAIRQAVLVAEGKGRYDGVEAQIHEELSTKLPISYRSNGGYLMPLSVLTPEEQAERADRKSTRLNSSHFVPSRMPSSA